jgi:hypothetical protein
MTGPTGRPGRCTCDDLAPRVDELEKRIAKLAAGSQ